MTLNFIAAVITSVMVSMNANANPVKSINDSESVPAVVEIAKTNVRSMVETNVNGSVYKYDYILDNDGKVVNRVTYTWNEDINDWKPSAAYSIVYTPDETVLTYAQYDNKAKTFSKKVQQTRYNADDYPVLMVVPAKCK